MPPMSENGHEQEEQEKAATHAEDSRDMAGLAAGKDVALDALMGRHGERLLHFLIRIVRDQDEAADLAQETFARVYRHRASFRQGAKFTTWLFSIATNLALNRLRYVERHPVTSMEAEPAPGATPLGETLPAGNLTPFEELAQRERAALIQEGLAALPIELRTPLILAEYEDLSYAEIAEVEACTEKAIEMRLYRARAALRAWLTSRGVRVRET